MSVMRKAWMAGDGMIGDDLSVFLAPFFPGE